MMNYTILDDAAAVSLNNRFTHLDVMEMMRFAFGTMAIPMMVVVMMTVAELL